MNYDKVLVISPHTDDGELGAGGTVSRFIKEGKEVYYVAFSGCESTVPEGFSRDTLRKECQKSLTKLGLDSKNISILDFEVRTFPQYRQEILDSLIKIKKIFKPGLVLVPSSNDTHQDHAVIHWESLRAFKKEASIWGYEHPWNNLNFTTDIFVKLELNHVEEKIAALKEYNTQIGRSYMREENIRSLVRTRGSQLDIEYAEAFELVRLLY